MSLTAGIIGLPNVGKSTLFNALCSTEALAANYPFTTVEANVGTVMVPDRRLTALEAIVQPKKTVPTTYEFTDIAGLVKDAHKGEGLGNRFLANIRDVDALIHVVRCFSDSNVSHVEGDVNVVRDVEIIETELMLADLEVIDNRLPKIEKKARLKVDKAVTKEYDVLTTVREALLENKPARTVALNAFEKALLKPYGLITDKPVLYIANVDEDMLPEGAECIHCKQLENYAQKQGAHVLALSAKIEAELIELDEEDQAEALAMYDIVETGRDRLIHATYKLLGLSTFFTTESSELRAWPFTEGMRAPECAGKIHTDFERGFIRAEVIDFDTLKAIGSLAKAKELGKIRSEGKGYIMQDGDVVLFRFNV